MIYAFFEEILNYLTTFDVVIITGIILTIAYARYLFTNVTSDCRTITILLILLFMIIGIASHRLPPEMRYLSVNLTFIISSVILFILA